MCVRVWVCSVAIVCTLPPFPFNPSNIPYHAITLAAYSIPSFTSLNDATLHLPPLHSLLTPILFNSLNPFYNLSCDN